MVSDEIQIAYVVCLRMPCSFDTVVLPSTRRSGLSPFTGVDMVSDESDEIHLILRTLRSGLSPVALDMCMVI